MTRRQYRLWQAWKWSPDGVGVTEHYLMAVEAAVAGKPRKTLRSPIEFEAVKPLSPADKAKRDKAMMLAQMNMSLPPDER